MQKMSVLLDNVFFEVIDDDNYTQKNRAFL